MNFNFSRLTIRTAANDDALCLGVLGIQVFLDTYATEGIRPSIAREVLAALSTAGRTKLLSETWHADRTGYLNPTG
jgi:hypothetical protein